MRELSLYVVGVIFKKLFILWRTNMDKLVICSVGTSITQKCSSHREMLKQNVPWDGNGDPLAGEAREYLRNLRGKLENEMTRRSLCAEINALDRLGIGGGDRVVLLATDTAHGKICAGMIREILTGYYGLSEAKVEVRRIEGLQVRDAKTLREKGLRNFVTTIVEYLENEQFRYSYETIFNPTGGFKGIVPFLTVLGMLYGKRTVYVFEFANELINLPPLPFSFDLSLFNRVRPALALLEEKTAVSEQEYLSRVREYVSAEHDLFMAFVEPCGNGQVTVSPLAFCLLAMEEGQPEALVSEEVLDKLKKIRGVSGDALKRLIANSANSLWRGSHVEHWVTTDLLVLKQPATAQRIAGFVRDGAFHVTNIFDDHDDYERTLHRYSKKDFADTRFIAWKDEKEVMKPAGATCSSDAITDVYKGERDRLLQENEECAEMLELEQLRKELSRKDEQLHSMREDREALMEQLRDRDSRIEGLKTEKPGGIGRFFRRVFGLSKGD